MEVSNIVNVIDAPCGTGKTEWAIQYIKDHPDQRVVFATPYLSEIDRVVNGCGKDRISPAEHYIQDDNGQTHGSRKIESFNDKLSKGLSVAVSHKTFLNATEETISYIRNSDYILILDEVLDVFSLFKDISHSKICKGDIDHLLDSGCISIDQEHCNKITWNSESRIDDWLYSEFETYIKLGNIYYVNRKDLLVAFSPEIFSDFNETFLLTYMFDGTLIYYYFQKYNIGYKLYSLAYDGDSRYITDYTPEVEKAFIQKVKPLITILDIPTLREYSKTKLSATWYGHATRDEIRNISNSAHSALVRFSKAKAADIMVAYPNKVDGAFKHAGMIKAKDISSQYIKLTDFEIELLYRDQIQDGQLTEADINRLKFDGVEKSYFTKQDWRILEKRSLCYVPVNERATNAYSDRWAMAYCYNFFINPTIKNYLMYGEDGRIQINEDRYALACIFQWIFRSRIRRDEPVVLYIPSVRMKNIFETWLNTG